MQQYCWLKKIPNRFKNYWLALLASVISVSFFIRSWPAKADDIPVFRIEFNDGVIMPLFLEVPANTTFKIELLNTGQTPVEFESIELRKEKVLAPQSQSFLVIKRLSPGDYKFFDDFHLDMPYAIIRAVTK